ncbi:MAG: DUF3472 domain-containing protein [Bacteroides sp.]|nr:DUF3472 domain-containing protein [Bacteroides sp.]
MKKFIAAALLLLAALSPRAEQLNIALSGNAYVTQSKSGAHIGHHGLSHWTDPESTINVFFFIHTPQTVDLSLLAAGHSSIKVSCADKSFTVNLNSDELTTVPVGTIQIDHPGYVCITLQGIARDGNSFGSVKELIIDDLEGPANFVHDFSDYWGRRGPSVHMAYQLPQDQTEWFYNEVTVPADGETLHSYYMAAGFGEGYFGMQYNSPSERRILFSVWSPFDTQDPQNIPDDQKIKLLRQGQNVHIGEFGNEGSGGQSYLLYPWKAGQTYKFLMQVKPDGNGNTIYTAYFFATDENQWKLIASFLRPMTDTWYTHAHSFLENFNPEQGHLSRKVIFGNQWARSNTGKWTPVTNATFTHDATAAAGVRLDYQGGNLDDSHFYLKMGGFFNQATPMGTEFNRASSSKAPKINFKKLEQL